MAETIHSAPADRVQLVMDPPQLIEWLKRANVDGAAHILSEFQAGRLGEPRTWFDLDGAASYIGIAAPTLCVYVKSGVGPASHKIGNARRFHRKDLDAWILAGGIYAHKPPAKRGRPKAVADN